MAPLSRFRKAASHEHPHDTVKQIKDFASIGADGEPKDPIPTRRLSRTMRTVLDELQEVLVIIILWISGLSALAPVAAEGVHKLMEIFTQPPIS
jgi:hypothetical protein